MQSTILDASIGYDLGCDDSDKGNGRQDDGLHCERKRIRMELEAAVCGAECLEELFGEVSHLN